MQSAGVEPTIKHHTFKVKGSNSVSAADNGEKKYKSIKTPKLKRDERDEKVQSKIRREGNRGLQHF